MELKVYGVSEGQIYSNVHCFRIWLHTSNTNVMILLLIHSFHNITKLLYTISLVLMTNISIRAIQNVFVYCVKHTGMSKVAVSIDSNNFCTISVLVVV